MVKCIMQTDPFSHFTREVFIQKGEASKVEISAEDHFCSLMFRQQEIRLKILEIFVSASKIPFKLSFIHFKLAINKIY